MLVIRSSNFCQIVPLLKESETMRRGADISRRNEAATIQIKNRANDCTREEINLKAFPVKSFALSETKVTSLAHHPTFGRDGASAL